MWADDAALDAAERRLDETGFLATVRGNDYRVPDLRGDQLRLVGEKATRILGYH
ncbi:hypothetical protein AB0C15_29765 [Micromonospora sp. NPDC048835]|uniref:hypothetical protein n=1 Tax=Micromonospora sp. NPDC048835 TaxID=3155147 RepID=UPI0033F080F3